MNKRLMLIKPPGFQTEDNDLTTAKPKEGDTEGHRLLSRLPSWERSQILPSF